MTNLTTEVFCRRFGACSRGAEFARQFATMRECYAALLRGAAGDYSLNWAIWVTTCEGVMPERNLRLFVVRCARRVQYLMTAKRSIRALDIAERFANGEATAEELEAASKAAEEVVKTAETWATAKAANAAVMATKSLAFCRVAAGATEAEEAAAAAAAALSPLSSASAPALACATEQEAQLALLAEFGNPFEEVDE